MAVQVFEHMYARQFRSVPAATAKFQIRQFLLLSSLHFLTLLDYKESSQQSGSILELSPEDLNRFRTLQKAGKQLQAIRGAGPSLECIFCSESVSPLYLQILILASRYVH